MKIKIIDYGITEDKLPFRAHYNDAGADVFATTNYNIQPGETIKIPLGFGLELPDGYAGFIFPRSGLSSKGIVCELPPIDSGYTGEIHAIVSNVSKRDYYVMRGDRIGQLVVTPIVIAEFVKITGDNRDNTAFGSSGR
jgi:dUTP pyrophosphatase